MIAAALTAVTAVAVARLVSAARAEDDLERRAAAALVRAAGLVYRPRRAEFAGELAAVQSEPGESGLGFAVGTLLGATFERVASVREPLQLRNVSKTFGTTTAVHAVSLDVPPGSITALLGGNGSGKSTLLRLIAGSETADSGTIRLGATPVTARCGQQRIAVVPHDLGLFPHLSVAANISLAGAPHASWVVDRHREARSARALLRHLGSPVDPTVRVGTLPLPDQIVVAIARAVQQPCQLLVLDEPTGNLSEAGAQSISRALRALCGDGISVIYVSHRIDDVFEVADQVAVLRDGELVHEGPIAETNPVEVVHHIVGTPVVA